MKRVVAAIAGVLCTFGVLLSQEIKKDSIQAPKYTYSYAVDQNALSSIDKSMITEHPFGDGIARKMHLLQDSYTYIEAATPTSPGEKTVVVKPYIYNSVLKVNRSLKKEVKKGVVSMEAAIADLDNCLNVAISIAGDETRDFESDLRKAKDVAEIIQVFASVELK
jgi:hypothetical protein